MEVSIGDFVLTGGELPAMVMTDCIARLIPGVIKKESYENDSFSMGFWIILTIQDLLNMKEWKFQKYCCQDIIKI